MASLIEELISTLDLENKEYEQLLQLSKEKTQIIIEGDVGKLNEIVALEQVHTDKIAALEGRRTEVVTDIATVLNKDVETLTVRNITELLKGQDKEQKALAAVHDKLKLTLNDMVVINDINKQLIEESLELINFNINYINGLNQMPEMANYTKGAYNSPNNIVNSRFDAKN
ncbi:MAG: flagellar protein FlgN [Lachnospiraceae bacterium]|nr:flagellar protein FlgN [Lachnospiraceae bacterium]